MFNRRRRPVLGAAVLVGASRAAARHEVQKQSVMDTQRDIEIQRQVEAQRRQEEEQERRTQRAVEEAMKKAAAENQAAQQSAAAVVSPPPQQFYNTQSPAPMMQTQDMGLLTTPGQPYYAQPEQFMRAPSPQPPAYVLSGSPSPDVRPKSAQDIGSSVSAPGSSTRFCTQCGFGCQVGDKFCSRCGANQASQ
ncbi:hypothetical protein ACHAQJ_008615 [Trichoderma viride]